MAPITPANAGLPYVSTGRLPGPDTVRAIVTDAYDRYLTNDDGELSRVYPALGRMAPDLFGVCVVSTHGETVGAGDTATEFCMMSVAKPFVFALACGVVGPQEVRRLVGVNATGLPFNSLSAIELRGDGRTNPMVNPGAIATTSLLPGGSVEERWQFLVRGLSRFAGRELWMDDEMYASASATNRRNRAITQLMDSYDRLACDPLLALDLYTRQSSLRVTARDLAVMGATLAGGGVNPLTGERVVDAASCRAALVVMTTAGLYETSGDWVYDVGLPGKSGIGGGIVTVSPGKGGLGTFAPLLDAAGNSVKGQLATRHISQQLGLDLFASQPEG
jgi:glutaminase